MQIRRTLAACLIAGLGTLLLCSCATDKSAKPQSVRQRFVPSTTDSASANWTALAPFPHAFGDPQVIAHASIGDTFPVQEAGGPVLFQVLVLAGDDNHLVLEIRAPESLAKKLNVKRNQPARLSVGSSQFDFSYPVIHVSSADPPTATKAMIIVRKHP
jgi:hypothetical protein